MFSYKSQGIYIPHAQEKKERVALLSPHWLFYATITFLKQKDPQSQQERRAGTELRRSWSPNRLDKNVAKVHLYQKANKRLGKGKKLRTNGVLVVRQGARTPSERCHGALEQGGLRLHVPL